MTITYVPRGIHSVREHGHVEPSVFDPVVVECQPRLFIAKGVEIDMPNPEVREQIALEIERSINGQSLYTARPDKFKLADAVLAIPRIRDALKLMDDIDSGAVELITYGSKQESSDAR